MPAIFVFGRTHRMNHAFLHRPVVATGGPHATQIGSHISLATHLPVDGGRRTVGISRRADESVFIDVVTQTRAALQNLLDTLADLGTGSDHLLELTVQLRHHGDIPMVEAAIATALGPEAPVRHYLCLADLHHRHYLVQIHGRAVAPAATPSPTGGENVTP